MSRNRYEDIDAALSKSLDDFLKILDKLELKIPNMPKNILLFNSPITFGKKDALEMGNLYPRIGIASIAAYLLDKGREVNLIDPNAEQLDLAEVKNKISKLNPDIVGIPAYTEEIHDADYTAKITKEVNPEIITVVCGPHASAIPAETLQEFSDFDIAVVGE